MDELKSMENKKSEANHFRTILKVFIKNQKNITPQRKLVINELMRETGVLTAYEIQKRISRNGYNLNISTIYRVLDFWIEKGLVHKLNSNSTYIILFFNQQIAYLNV